MARRQTPWHRKQTGWWMIEIDGKQTKLVEGPKDEKTRLLAEEKLVRRPPQAPPPVAPQSARTPAPPTSWNPSWATVACRTCPKTRTA